MDFFYLIYVIWFLSTIYPVMLISYVTRSGTINALSISYLTYVTFQILKVLIGPSVCYPLNSFCSHNGLLDVYLLNVVALEVVQLVIFNLVLSVVIIFSSNYKPFVLLKCKSITNKDLQKLSILFYLFFVISFMLLANNSFGIYNWILDPRKGYQFHRSGAGFYFAASLSFLSLSFTLSVLRFSNPKNDIYKLAKIALFYIANVYLLGSKGFILSFALFFVVYLWFLGYEKIKRVLFYSSLLSMVLVGVNILASVRDFSAFKFFVSYFDAYVNSAYIYSSLENRTLDFFYGDILASSFWEFVPRVLNQDKPYVYGNLLVNEFMFPGAAELGHTPSFGGPIFYFADYGIVGVILSSIPIGKLLFFYTCYALLKYKDVSYYSSNLLTVFVFSTAFSPNFLHYIPGALSIIFLIVCFMFSYVITSIRR